MSTQESESRIELLTESNFSTWFVDIRAKLRSKDLWKYTQQIYESEDSVTATVSTSKDGESPQVTRKELKAINDWKDKSEKAADLMTPTISPHVKQKLTEAEFNDGYLMLSRLRVLLQPTGSSEFMRLSKEYYTLQHKSFKSMSEYLTHIKVLEEKINATKVILDADNRTILCLSMSLPQEYQYLVQIWAVTPTITAEKARTMVLEASRQHHMALHNSSDPAFSTHRATEQVKCEHCGSTKHSVDRCWPMHPHLAPKWFKLKMEEQAKGKGKSAEQAQKFQAKLATTVTARDDDFVDYNSTHISA